jgi:hypothetical protein
MWFSIRFVVDETNKAEHKTHKESEILRHTTSTQYAQHLLLNKKHQSIITNWQLLFRPFFDMSHDFDLVYRNLSQKPAHGNVLILEDR